MNQRTPYCLMVSFVFFQARPSRDSLKDNRRWQLYECSFSWDAATQYYIWNFSRNFWKLFKSNIQKYLLCSGFEEKFLTSFEGSKGMLSWPGPFIPHMALFRRARLSGINNWLLKIIWKKFLISAIILRETKKNNKDYDSSDWKEFFFLWFIPF